MARYAQIRKLDVADGPGCRVAIYFQGCPIHCPGCHNQSIWDFDGGKEFTSDTLDTIYELAEPDYIQGLSIVGGEPLAPQYIEATLLLVDRFKEKYPNKDIWLWTGYYYKDIKKEIEGHDIDVIVDGPFVEKLKDLRLEFRGSSNQHIIYLKK